MTQLTAEQKIKQLVLEVAYNFADIEMPPLTAENIDEVWDRPELEDYIQDAKGEVRGGQVETNLDTEYSRHYESKAVAAQSKDGSWVGWTYWYGGGKHGEPESIDWIEYAYDLNCAEEEKTMIVRTFTVKDEVGKE